MTALRRAIGCMTGTSLDGLDVALVTTRGHGLDLEIDAVEPASESFGPEVDPLRAFASGTPLSAAEIADLAISMARRHADLIQRTWPSIRPDLIALHGQTVTHQPPRSWQLVHPWTVAAAFECPVVFDLRGADLAAGGRGAPITPVADAVLYRRLRQEDTTTLVVNLGGFANATVLEGTDPGSARGFDCCPCNHLLDAASRELVGIDFDDGGRIASTGHPDRAAAATLHDAIARLAEEGRSGGDGDEHRATAVAVAREVSDRGTPADGLATICVSIADAVTRAIDHALEGLPGSTRPVRSVVLAGGGVRNLALVEAIREAFGRRHPDASIIAGPVERVEPQAREAAAMAVLGLLAADGVRITTADATGRPGPSRPDGCWIR